MEGQKRLQALFLTLKEKYNETENMLEKVEEKSLAWVGEAQTEKS